MALAFIGWSDGGAKAAIFEAVADAGLRQEAAQRGGSRRALSHQVESSTCLPCSTSAVNDEVILPPLRSERHECQTCPAEAKVLAGHRTLLDCLS